ncbi:hypothetical protein [Alicyclobacillus pomorum]|jgi:hypothetical protein|uniref:hypothetical protein n=1 Tax=Alicyclobacillus pomorum TaxID=204470 RepID=UPI00041D8526|nr:hypothetical protein [Alicyclobacillus pomorum]
MTPLLNLSQRQLLSLPQRQLGQILALLMVLGYVDINVVTFRNGQFYFVLRGPIFSRLTSGIARYLRAPGNSPEGGPTAQAYVKIEALLAYLLFTGQAYIHDPTFVGAGIVFSVQSEWFRFKALQKVLQARKNNELDRMILALLNLGVGWGLVQNTFGITGVTPRPFDHQLGFSVTSDALASKAKTPGPTFGITAIPNGGPLYRVLNRLVGVLLMVQQLHIYGVSLGKGGRIVFGITGEVIRLKVFPKMLEEWFKSDSANRLAGNSLEM